MTVQGRPGECQGHMANALCTVAPHARVPTEGEPSDPDPLTLQGKFKSGVCVPFMFLH